MKNKLSTKQGFTIIEVVLVLAIAGLIFLMVFVAFPALQRNQRDTQRRQDYSDLSAAIISSASNSNGNFPAAAAASDSNNLLKSIGKQESGKSKDAAGNIYKITITSVPASGSITVPTLSAGDIYVYQNADCGTSGSSPTKLATENTKKYAIYAYLENGSYCYAGQI